LALRTSSFPKWCRLGPTALGMPRRHKALVVSWATWHGFSDLLHHLLFLYPDTPEATPSPVSTIQPSQTAGAASNSSSSKSHSGAIAGGVVGGVVGASLLIGVIFWYLRRRRSRSQPEPTLYSDNRTNVSEGFGTQSPSIGKYYVRAVTRLLLTSRFLCGF